jgi:hypothetical protein
MEQLNSKLILLTQKLIKEELATPLVCGRSSNLEFQQSGCIVPISDEQALVVLNNGCISAITPSALAPESKKKFIECYVQITSEPIVFETSERIQNILYLGLGAEIDVVLRNDRVSDSEKIKNLIAVAAQKVHENTQFREKIKEDSINFILEKFKMDSSQPILIGAKEPIASVIEVDTSDLNKIDKNEDEINISELAKQHTSEALTAINQQPTILTAPISNLPPLS